MKPSTKRTLKKVFLNISAALLTITYVGNLIAAENAGQINAFLGTSTSKTVKIDETLEEDYPRYFESTFQSIADLKAAGLAKVQEVESEGIVLLKNDGILPLNKEKLTAIGVVGPNANSRAALIGNYHGTSSRYITVLEGIQDEVGEDVRVYYAEGSHLFKDRVENLGKADDRIAEAQVEIGRAHV